MDGNLHRREFLGVLGGALLSGAVPRAGNTAPPPSPGVGGRPPNILFFLADDLGYGEVGCYGQEKIRTPVIDRLATEGVRLLDHYAGSAVCAPSRCVLLTGLHTGHAWIRDNSPWARAKNPYGEGQEPLPPGTVTLARLLQEAGYATACIGKWGLGGPVTTGAPERQGFDRFFGYLCQAQAHNYYPDHLWRNGTKVPLDNPPLPARVRLQAPPEDWSRFQGKAYAPDLMLEEALRFVRGNKDRPFFLYYPTPLPHVPIQVPEDALAEYRGQWKETPYLGEKGYLPHPCPRAGYAAMVSRMDRDLGRLLSLIRELGLEAHTLVVFSSDNGPTFDVGGADTKFFHGTAGLRGRKASLYEGGLRVPAVVRWPGRIPAGRMWDIPSAFQDWLPTLLEAAGVEPPDGRDGLSLLPGLTGKGVQERHPFLYWELGRQQALRKGRWKLVRTFPKEGAAPAVELFDLEKDPGEKTDRSRARPETAEALLRLMEQARAPSPIFHVPCDPPAGKGRNGKGEPRRKKRDRI